MKKKIAMILSLVLAAFPAPLTAYADGAYCPEGLPVADDQIEYVDAETAAVLFDMRDQLLENVYANYPDTEVHAVSASDIVGNVYVMYTSDTQAELDAAKAYCEANDFDMELMQFYLYDESKIVPEQGSDSEEETKITPGFVPDGLPVADDQIEYVDAETAAVLFGMCNQLLENVYVNYPDTEVHAVSASDIVGNVYVMYTSDTQAELDAAKAYCEANDFDMELMQFYLYDESKIVPELGNESEDAAEAVPLAGDISADDRLGLVDAVYLQKHLLNAACLNAAQYQRADVDQNHTVDAFDLALLKRMLIS